MFHFTFSTFPDGTFPGVFHVRQPFLSNFLPTRYTEIYFRNLIKSTRNQIIFTIFRLIWNQTDVRLDPNQSKDGKYNLISGLFDKILNNFVQWIATATLKAKCENIIWILTFALRWLHLIAELYVRQIFKLYLCINKNSEGLIYINGSWRYHFMLFVYINK